MKRKTLFIMLLVALFVPLAVNAQKQKVVTQKKDLSSISVQNQTSSTPREAQQVLTPMNDFSSVERISLRELYSNTNSGEYDNRDLRDVGDYELVTASQTDWSGEYVITYVSGTTVRVLSGKATNGNYGAYATVTASNNILTASDVDSYKVTIAKDGNYYTLKLGTQYLGYTSNPTGTSGSNYLHFSTSTPTSNQYRWTIAYSNGTLTITNANKTNRLIKWNNSSNQYRFACYGTGQQNISLFKKIESNCAKPEGLAVDETSITTNSATATWTAGDATLWNLRYKSTDASTWTTVNGLTAATYTFSNLNDGDAYEVQVQADCGNNEVSGWTASVEFYTDCAVKSLPFFCGFESVSEYGCFYPYNTSDASTISNSSYRTGAYCWRFTGNGEAQYLLSPDFDGTQAIALSFWYRIRSTTYPQYFQVGYAVGDDIYWEDMVTASNTSYTEYTAEFPKGTQYVVIAYIADENTNSYLSMDDFNFTVATGCIAPYALTASDITKNSATISWNQGNDETQWQVCLNGNESNPTLVNTDSYTFTGLTPETTYTVKVRSYCDATHQSGWSEEITFTTEATCPAPENLTAGNISNISANITWDRYDEVELEYAEVTGTIATTNGSWLQYDDGNYQGPLGNSTAYDWTWASMYPASMLSGKTVLSKVSIYESSYNTEDITIDIYSGGTSSPETKIYTETVTTEHSGAFHEVELASPVTIDPSQNLWIVLTTYGTYVMPLCSSTEVNNQWVENEGWYNIEDLSSSLSGYGWMIRGYIEEIDYSSLTWQPLGTQSSPYELTGLSPETQYVVRARANCGAEDGYSQWAVTAFTTLDNCADPFNLTATDITGTSATLNWTGAQENYNVSYKKAYFFEDFEGGAMPDGWTVINNGSDSYNWYYDNTNSHAHSGSGVMSSASSVSNGTSWNDFTPDHWLITPLIDLQGTMSVWVRSQQSNASYYQEHFTIYVSTRGNTSISDFTDNVIVRESETTIDYIEYTADLSSYAGQQGYIAIRHHNCTGQFRMNIDDFGIFDAEQNTTATGNSVTINGLDLSTEYMWQVQGVNCDGNNTATNWSDVAFFTTTDVVPVLVSSITVNPNEISPTVGATYSIIYTVLPADATNPAVTFSSSDDTVATVDENGTVTAVAAGTAIITIAATDGSGVTGTLTVNVMNIDVEEITADDVTMMTGETATITYTVAPNNATDASVTFTSANTAIATVDANGVVTGVAAGETTITIASVQNPEVTKEITVTVESNPYAAQFTVNAPAVASPGDVITVDFVLAAPTAGTYTGFTGLDVNLYFDNTAFEYNSKANGAVANAVSNIDYGQVSIGGPNTNYPNRVKALLVTPANYPVATEGIVFSVTFTVLQELGSYTFDAEINEFDYTTGEVGNSNTVDIPYEFTPSTVTVSVLQTYTKHIIGYNSEEGNGTGNYYLIASPIGNVAPTAVTNMTTGSYDLYYFDQTQELEWINYEGANGNFDMERGKGYLYANSETVDLIFIGTANTNGEVTLTYSEDNPTDETMYGRNLVGNPFAEDAYIEDGRDFYRMNDDGDEIMTDASNGKIDPMEGVFVYAETDKETLTFTTTEPENQGSKAMLAINLSRNSSVIDRAIVRFGRGRTLPKFQLFENSTKIYIEQDNHEYAVVNSDTEGEMPVNFKASEDGSYTIAVNINDVETHYLHLIDNITGADIDLLQTPSYTFTARSDDYASRFKLVFSASADDDNFAFIGNGDIIITDVDANATLQIVDVTGRILFNENATHSVSTANLAKGVYVLRLINGSDVKTQKIVIR